MKNYEPRGQARGCHNTVNKRSRIVYLFDEINEETSLDVVSELMEMDTDKKRRPIRIFISSPGGDCGYGFAIIDVLINLTCPTIGIGVGDLCSMAPAILIACTSRCMTEHAQIMLHPITVGTGDYVKFAKSRVMNAETVEKMYDEFFLKRTSIPKKFYMRAKDKELWLSADEALKYGIIQKVIGRPEPKKAKKCKEEKA